ncbi:MAG: ATP-binding cassette domain-containing protein, partial [Chloroflexi bacterium]|nr:ATP-binding cassette domain-containing protein [Chloroflexota bacterium]
MVNGAPQAALIVENVSVRLGGEVVLSDVTFEVQRSTLLGVVGPNGGGKSTLFNAVAGILPLQTGRVLIYGVPPDKSKGRIAMVTSVVQVTSRPIGLVITYPK